MRSVMDTVATATITINPVGFQVIWAAICIAIILEDLARTENMQCCGKPEHIEDCKDSIWQNRKNNKSLNFADDLCSYLYKY